jgi:hypothetical protein
MNHPSASHNISPFFSGKRARTGLLVALALAAMTLMPGCGPIEGVDEEPPPSSDPSAVIATSCQGGTDGGTPCPAVRPATGAGRAKDQPAETLPQEATSPAGGAPAGELK